MKSDVMSNIATLDDAALVAEVLRGNRDAFGQLVARYQSAVSSLAYSTCGNISQSEDLAQETFLIAWRKLGELKEPAKFKSWLYGIARNLANNTSRQRARNPLAASEQLNESLATTAPASNPTELAIGKEEEAILWRSLEQIPENYREPLILFYREHQSIERVAAILELSEEAARQRLSRGRKLLQERVLAFVEGALAQTAPGPLFTLGVLAALPAMTLSAKAATFGAAAKGGTMAKGAGLFAMFGAYLIPVLMLFAMFPNYRQWKKAGLEGKSLKSLKYYFIFIAVSVVVMVVAISLLMDHGAALVKKSPALFVALNAGGILGYFFVVGIFARRFVVTMAKEAAAKPDAAVKAAKIMGSGWEYRSGAELLGLPLIHVRCGVRPFNTAWKPVIAWIAISDSFAFGALFAYGGVALAPLSIGACSIGLISYGAMAIGGITWGGFSFGVLAFGAITFGWEAFSGGCAFAWHFAAGYDYAIAHDFAYGQGVARAAEVNTPFVKALFQSGWGYKFCVAAAPWFFWLMWAWAIPMIIGMVVTMVRAGRRQKLSQETGKNYDL